MKRISKRNIGNVSFINFGCKINKRGQWQNYLLPAIMAVLVLGISFYFIFNEYFSEEDIGREVCKQSVMVRSAMPEIKKAGLNLVSLKDDFPLKCKTKVIEVTADDVALDDDGNRKVDNIIGDALAECWFIFGNGDGNVFASGLYGMTTTCLPCARIHLTNEAKEAVKEEMGGKIDIEGLLNGAKLDDKFFYLNYLKGVGKLFEPFNPMGTGSFNLGGDKFSIESIPLKKRINSPDFATKLDSDVSEWGTFGQVTLPKYLNVSRGDLIIAVGEVTTSANVDVDFIPYMFYFQNGQDGYLEEMDKTFFQWGVTGFDSDAAENICNAWEGIPA